MSMVSDSELLFVTTYVLQGCADGGMGGVSPPLNAHETAKKLVIKHILFNVY